MDDGTGSRDGMEQVIKIDEGRIRGHLDNVVRESVEETLNTLLDAEADALCNAKRPCRRHDAVKPQCRCGNELTLGLFSQDVIQWNNTVFKNQLTGVYGLRPHFFHCAVY